MRWKASLHPSHPRTGCVALGDTRQKLIVSLHQTITGLFSKRVILIWRFQKPAVVEGIGY